MESDYNPLDDPGSSKVSARIVVVEDDPDIRRLVVLTLRRRGYYILEASDGDTALALIRGEHPDLVVLDIMLPGLSGLEVTKALSSDPSTTTIPILLLSARGQATEIRAGMESGARAYLTKPFVPRELVVRIRAILGERNGGPSRKQGGPRA